MMDDRYKILQREAGGGGFGRIDKAYDKDLERNLAIKTLDPIFKIEPSQNDIERFKREAIALASLSHPNIPSIYDFHFSEDTEEFKILFEWVEGEPLRKIIDSKGVLSLEEIRKWFSNICSALDHAHKKGIIHRDVKPSNMIVTENFESCYLVDFGIALKPDEIQRLTQGTAVGTPGYMSPEQQSAEDIEPSSDLYSLAIVLYECLAGMRPTVGEYKPLNSINEAIPPSIDDLIRKCLVRKKDRLKTPTEFIEKLVNALQPHSSFSKVLSDGPLHEIQASLSNMGAIEYSNLPFGQRKLLMTRIKDLIRVDDRNMRNAVASLLSTFIRVGHLSKEEDYSLIVENSFDYAYEREYTPNWKGDSQLRISINNTAKEYRSEAHKIVSSKLLQFLNNVSNIEDKENWYYHDLRIVLQNLLANPHCSEDHAEELGENLDYINEISH